MSIKLRYDFWMWIFRSVLVGLVSLCTFFIGNSYKKIDDTHESIAKVQVSMARIEEDLKAYDITLSSTKTMADTNYAMIIKVQDDFHELNSDVASLTAKEFKHEEILTMMRIRLAPWLKE